MKKIKIFCAIATGLLVLFIPIFIVIIVSQLNEKMNIIAEVDFWYSYMAYFGTVVIALVAIWQNFKAQKTSEITQNLSIKFDKLNIMQNYCFAQINKKLFYKYIEKSDRKIIWSGMGKNDFSSMLFMEKGINNDAFLDEAYFEFSFHDCSNSMIKNIEIINNTLLCLQNYNDDEVEYPVFMMTIHNKNSVAPIWIDKDIFKIRLKIYCQQNGVCSNFLKNEKQITFLFRIKYTSVTNVECSVLNKVIIKKKKGVLFIAHCESQLLNVDMAI